MTKMGQNKKNWKSLRHQGRIHRKLTNENQSVGIDLDKMPIDISKTLKYQ